MAKDSTYQGWKNYETWAVKLWLDNDQGSQEWAQEIITDNWDKDCPWKTGDALKDSLEESMPEVEGMWSDLLSAAWSKVDFTEIAQTFAEDLELEAPDES